MEALVLSVIAVSGRMLPHPANATPVGAIALISGWRLGLKKGILVTVSSMLVSDLFIGFHPVMWATYGSLLLGVCLGRFLFTRADFPFRVGLGAVSSAVFYVVTNYAVWALPGSMYPHTMQGLIESYVMALPFFRSSLIADIFFMTVFLAAYEAVGCLYGNSRFLPSGFRSQRKISRLK